jgi:SAM-dependent methyltransferase
MQRAHTSAQHDNAMPDPYELSARLYDRIYGFKQYAHEAASVRAFIARHAIDARSLLEVACGTGSHLASFQQWFEVEGVDLNPSMLDLARTKLPGVSLHQGDLRSFELPRRFDVVTCLFSSIGYVRSLDELGSAVANLARHLNPGGLLIIEPWFAPEQWNPGQVTGQLMIDEADLKLARFVVSEVHGRMCVTPMHHLVAEPSGVTYFVERHELFMATKDEYRAAFLAAGLDGVTFDAELLPRGAWIGRAPKAR